MGEIGVIIQRIKQHRNSMTNMGFYFMASFIPMLINLFLSPLYSLNLSAEDFAIVGYFASFQALIAPLMLFEMHQNYMREYFFRGEEERKSLRSTLFRTFLIFPFIIMLLSLAGLYVYLRLSKSGTDMPFSPYALLTFMPWALAGIYRLELIDRKVQRKAKDFFCISITNSALLILSTVLCVVIFKWGATGKLLGALIPALVMFLWSFFKHTDVFKDCFDWELLKSSVVFCLPLVLAATLDFFSGGFDKVYLQKYVSIDQLGIYTIGLSIANYLGVFSTAMGETFNPDIYESIANNDNKRALKYIVVQIVMMSIIVIAFILLAKYIIYVLTAGRYVESTPFARIAALTSLSVLVRGMVTPFIYSAKKTNVILVAKIISSIASVLTYSILIKHYHLYGAAWGFVLCPLYFALFSFILYKADSMRRIKIGK